jgi:hypothetical protein
MRDSVSSSKEPKRRIAPKVLLRCKQKIRGLTQRTRGISQEQMMKELAAYLRGWKSYFGFRQTPSLLKTLDKWIRRRLRSMIWKQWKSGKQRMRSCVISGSVGSSPHTVPPMPILSSYVQKICVYRFDLARRTSNCLGAPQAVVACKSYTLFCFTAERWSLRCWPCKINQLVVAF